ncbi:MAG TPA: tyrosine-type recombinase/integrase [Aggregatilineales bacterium]|nr:tyrosine-type recombinase/integrase [Aggregatilineales bacterium]
MDFVEPIRDKKKITQIKNQLEGAKRYRDLLLFVVGINSALRISDLLPLRVGNFIDKDGETLERFLIREEKRDKRNVVVINDSIRDALDKYKEAYPQAVEKLSHFVFFSSKRSGPDYTRPLPRVQAWRLISEMCYTVSLGGNYGPLTLRKTWDYQARQSGVPLELIMAKLNHSNIAMTKRYLGITDAELQAIAEGLNL